jgi:hypothetical protein
MVLARRAQLTRRLPVSEVVLLISHAGGGGRDYSVRRLELAAKRATSRWSRWFRGIDTCLTRSLVLGGLLVGRGDVELNLGFRPGEDEPNLDGHAWITIDGRPIGVDGSLAEGRYTRVLAVPFSKGTMEE